MVSCGRAWVVMRVRIACCDLYMLGRPESFTRPPHKALAIIMYSATILSSGALRGRAISVILLLGSVWGPSSSNRYSTLLLFSGLPLTSSRLAESILEKRHNGRSH